MGTLATASYAVVFFCSVVSWFVLLAGTGGQLGTIKLLLPCLEHLYPMHSLAALARNALQSNTMAHLGNHAMLTITSIWQRCRGPLAHLFAESMAGAHLTHTLLQVPCTASAQGHAYTTLASPGGLFGSSSSSWSLAFLLG